jgi:IS30 family transposase
VEDWAKIRRLHRAEAMPIKAIARLLGVSKNTVTHCCIGDWRRHQGDSRQGGVIHEYHPAAA